MSRPLLSTLLLREGTFGPPGSGLVADPLEVLAELGVHAETELPIARSSSPDSQQEDRPASDASLEGDSARRGRYRLIRELGRGGMGRVALAEDLELKRLVAVKEIDVDQKENEALLARFVAEARITAQLDHPAIVPVHEVGLTQTGTLFYAMKCVTGHSLRDVLRAKAPEPGAPAPWSMSRLLGALVQVGRALHHAHERGALHLDVKPENIMLGGGGEVFLMDWGLAERFTEAGVDPYCVLGGTPGYMPPELFERDRARIGPWTDAFAYGAVLYETLVRSPAIPGDTLAEVKSRTLDEDVPDPRVRHPTLRVPDALADVCSRALARDPRQRTRSVLEMVEAIERWLDGSRRAAEARERLGEARIRFDEWERLLERLKTLRAREAEEEAKVQPWMAVDRKQPWFDARREVARGEALVAQAFAEAVSAGERALASDPEEPEVRAWMASLWWRHREAAEQRGDEGQVTFASFRVRAYDIGHYARRLAAMGRMVLHTDPPGAQVCASRYDRTGIVWTLTDRLDLGKSPVVVDLPTGSWLCEVQAPQRPLVRYPVVIDATAAWDNSGAPLRLPTQGECPDGFCYVPGGLAIVGGDIVPSHASPRRRVDVASIFIARFPVTAAEYCEFLNAISQRSADEAVARAPRSSRSSGTSGEPYWIPPRPGEPWVIPEVDTDGSRWTLDWPVMGVSWADAQAFAAWRAERDARPIRLPFHLEWEKGARGVDGRLRPWGMEMDASLCKCSQSRSEGLQPEPVGTFPTDVSPYGIQDTCGGVREWLADEHFDGDPSRRPASGGSWASSASQCRLTNRFGFETLLTRSFLGFRLACSLTRAR